MPQCTAHRQFVTVHCHHYERNVNSEPRAGTTTAHARQKAAADPRAHHRRGQRTGARLRQLGLARPDVPGRRRTCRRRRAHGLPPLPHRTPPARRRDAAPRITRPASPTRTSTSTISATVTAPGLRFAATLLGARQSVDAPHDPTFVGVDVRRREALLRAVTGSAPRWSRGRTAGCRRTSRRAVEPADLRAAGRSVGRRRTTTPPRAVEWLMAKVIAAIEDGEPAAVA